MADKLKIHQIADFVRLIVPRRIIDSTDPTS
jgi:hypothetical protein